VDERVDEDQRDALIAFARPNGQACGEVVAVRSAPLILPSATATARLRHAEGGCGEDQDSLYRRRHDKACGNETRSIAVGQGVKANAALAVGA